MYRPPLPFSQRLKQDKIDEQFIRFENMFKKLEINIPFAEALAQMPNYEKFMKDFIDKKRKLDDYGTVNLLTKCSAIIDSCLGRVSGINNICFLSSSYRRSQATAV